MVLPCTLSGMPVALLFCSPCAFYVMYNLPLISSRRLIVILFIFMLTHFFSPLRTSRGWHLVRGSFFLLNVSRVLSFLAQRHPELRRHLGIWASARPPLPLVLEGSPVAQPVPYEWHFRAILCTLEPTPPPPPAPPPTHTPLSLSAEPLCVGCFVQWFWEAASFHCSCHMALPCSWEKQGTKPRGRQGQPRGPAAQHCQHLHTCHGAVLLFFQ